ncbi:MAG: hypothetical protein QXY91_06210 [Thermoproteota archaeon]
MLKTLGIPKNDIKIYINEHRKTKKFIKVVSKHGIEIKAYKRVSRDLVVKYVSSNSEIFKG